MIIADDAPAAGRELESALERVSRRVIAEQLCVLDSSFGFSVSRLILKRFEFLATNKTDNTDDEIVSESVFEPAPPLTLAAGVSAEVINVE